MIKLPLTFFALVFGSVALAESGDFNLVESRGFDLELGPYLSSVDYREKMIFLSVGDYQVSKGVTLPITLFQSH